MLDLLSMSKPVLDHHAKVTRTKYKGIHDPRLRAREFSVGAWMVRLAGLATDEGPEFQRFTRPDKYRAVRDGMSSLADPDTKVSSEDKEAFTQKLKQLRDDVITSADVVVTTLSNAANNWIYRSSNFEVVIVDEAGQASEPQVWNVIAM
jgi:broad specificity phosphatase PhoE